MYRIDENYLKLPGSHLFSTIVEKITAFTDAHQGKHVIRMGIGNVTKPLHPTVIQALHRAVSEVGEAKTFRSCGSENGYAFLRDRMVEFDYKAHGTEIRSGEILISDGVKDGSGNIQETPGLGSTVAAYSPVYPVYLDTNVMAGRSGDYDAAKGIYASITYLPCAAENDFTPTFPVGKVPDLIYLCSSNNPTGTIMRKGALQHWVDYANESGSVILFNAVYEAYITGANVPHTIYGYEGARTCAIKLRSFSKKTGFTRLRLGAMVVPCDLRKKVKRANGTTEGVEPHTFWSRRHGTRFNGASYIIQRAGEVAYFAEGQRETAEQVAYYMRNAHYIYETLKKTGSSAYDGMNVPYVWVRAPGDMTGWEFLDTLLEKATAVGTPDSGFKSHGEHYFRFSAFDTYEDTVEAIARIQALQL